MKVKDLINEVRIFQNNFVKIEIIENELNLIFDNKAPEIKFDKNGMFIILNTFEIYNYENYFSENAIPFNKRKFFLSDGGLENDRNNTKKYYIEFTRPVDTEEADINQKNDSTDSSETPTPTE